MAAVEQTQTSAAPASPPQPKSTHLRPLSTRQERRLMDYLDERLLNLMRNYKKRAEASTSTPTLDAYLHACRQILSIVLQIPPIQPSASLRTAYLLHLSNDALSAVTGYSATLDSLPGLLEWLDDLDRAWLVALTGQIWQPDARAGVAPPDTVALDTRKLITQTDRTRLKSMLISGSAVIEDWVGDVVSQPELDVDDVESLMQRLGIVEGSVRLFPRSLDELERISGLG
ncbi:hypothetical protein HDZ31DRAFT_84314 [Schizophyllum fasciatum]